MIEHLTAPQEVPGLNLVWHEYNQKIRSKQKGYYSNKLTNGVTCIVFGKAC